jgi:hypothetical protein
VAGRTIIWIFERLLAVIALWFGGLLLCNLREFRVRLLSFAELMRVLAGAALAFAALLLLYESFPGMSDQQFSFFAIGTFIIALAAEFFIGDDVRRLVRRR